MMLRNIRTSELMRNSVKLLSASTIGQFAAILVYPIVTRQYSPAELGVLSLFLSIVGIGTILASGQYENAIMTEKEDKDAANTFNLCFLLNLMWCLLLAALIGGYFFFGDKTFPLGSFHSFLPYVPLLIFLSSTGYVLSFWFNRNNQFGRSATYNIVQSTSNSVAKIMFGTAGWHQFGLIAAAVVGQIIGIGAIFFRKKSTIAIFRFNYRKMLNIAKKNADFPKYTLPHRLLYTVAGNLPIFIFSASFNMTEVGFFTLGITIGLKPICTLARSVNQVLFRRIGHDYASQTDCYPLIKNVCVKSLSIAIPIAIVLYLLLPSLAAILFGKEWIDTGYMLQLMLPWLTAAAIGSSLNFIPSVFGKQREAFWLEVGGTLLQLTALGVGVWLNDLRISISLLSTANTLFIATQIGWYLLLAKKNHD